MEIHLSHRLQGVMKAKGASIVGFADLTATPSDSRDGLRIGVSFGVALNPDIMREIGQGPTSGYVEECLRLDGILDSIGEAAAGFLSECGYAARKQVTTNIPGTAYPLNFTTPLPHKTVATRAGLGWIGKCALLVTRQFGSAVRLGSVLTDAELPVGTPTDASACDSCTACVDVCPAKAISGKSWEVGVPRDSLVDPTMCRKTASERLNMRIGREVVGRTFCGMCITACPWTNHGLRTKR